MNKPTAATLLSILVYPGAGHFLLKKYVTGTVLAGAASVALYIVVVKTLRTAVIVADKIQRGEVPLDVFSITESITQHTRGADGQMLNLAAAVLLIAWLIGIVDVYRLGRSYNNDEARND